MRLCILFSRINFFTTVASVFVLAQDCFPKSLFGPPLSFLVLKLNISDPRLNSIVTFHFTHSFKVLKLPSRTQSNVPLVWHLLQIKIIKMSVTGLASLQSASSYPPLFDLESQHK